jgi:hypothetical protein
MPYDRAWEKTPPYDRAWKKTCHILSICVLYTKYRAAYTKYRATYRYTRDMTVYTRYNQVYKSLCRYILMTCKNIQVYIIVISIYHFRIVQWYSHPLVQGEQHDDKDADPCPPEDEECFDAQDAASIWGFQTKLIRGLSQESQDRAGPQQS